MLLLAGVVGWMLRKTIRGRIGLARQLLLDPDIAEFMIVFDWSRKVLYLPTIAGAIVCGILMTFLPEGGQASLILGGSWLGLFFLNFLAGELVDGERVTPPCFHDAYTWIEQDWDRFGWDLPRVRAR